jgi:hypothetical protein
LVKEHSHSVNAAVNGLSALPATAQPMASVKAMSRFLHHEEVPLPALIEPVQESIQAALTSSTAPVALVMHDWSMFVFTTHTSKTDCYQRTHEHDVGYDVGTALVVEAQNGQPLGPMEMRCRTKNGILSTRPGEENYPSAHVDELTGVLAASKRWKLPQPLVHIVDREADSVGHYRDWDAAGHRFLVRAKDDRRVLWKEQSLTLKQVQSQHAKQFQKAFTIKTNDHGWCQVQVAEAGVVLDRPARTWVDGTQKLIAGRALPLRLVLTQVVDEQQTVLAEWLLLTNVEACFDAATIARWYAWRWRIESFHKLLKTAGMNAEEWQQTSGAAFAKRLAIASMACLTVWSLQQDDSEEATRLKGILIRLSGRQMKHKVKDTAPALLAGLEKLLAFVDLLESEGLEDILSLARTVLPKLFNSS